MPVRVAIVDDSPFTCGLLAEYLAEVPDVKVIGSAHSGAAALELVKTKRPDVLTLDVEMPDADGVTVLRQLMREWPLPVVMVSGLSRRAAEITHTAISEGAVDFVLKYSAGSNLDTATFARDFAIRIREAGRQRRVKKVATFARTCAKSRPSHVLANVATVRGKSVPVVVIGSSTGGPSALNRLFSEWSNGLNAAVVVVQHMPAGFTKTLALQLDRIGNIPVREAQTGDQLAPGVALVTPGDWHLVIKEQGIIELTQADKVSGHRPSIDVTMKSAARVYGAGAIGVILTGMGNDGSDGLATIHDAGGQTLAQDANSSVVFGMPQRVIERGVVKFTGPPETLGREIARLTSIKTSDLLKVKL